MKTLTHNALLAIVTIWVFGSILFIAGEPANDMTFADVVFAKVVGFGALFGGLAFGAWCRAKGWLHLDKNYNDANF